MEELLATREGFLRIQIAREGKVGIARVSAVPTWQEPWAGEPFEGESLRILSRCSRVVIDVAETSSLSNEENQRLTRAVKALRLRFSSDVVIVGMPWKDAWVSAGFPVFCDLKAAIEDYGPESENSPVLVRRNATLRKKEIQTKPSKRRYGRRANATLNPEEVEGRVSNWIHASKRVLIELVLLIGTLAFLMHYAGQYLPVSPAASPPSTAIVPGPTN